MMLDWMRISLLRMISKSASSWDTIAKIFPTFTAVIRVSPVIILTSMQASWRTSMVSRESALMSSLNPLNAIYVGCYKTNLRMCIHWNRKLHSPTPPIHWLWCHRRQKLKSWGTPHQTSRLCLKFALALRWSLFPLIPFASRTPHQVRMCRSLTSSRLLVATLWTSCICWWCRWVCPLYTLGASLPCPLPLKPCNCSYSHSYQPI